DLAFFAPLGLVIIKSIPAGRFSPVVFQRGTFVRRFTPRRSRTPLAPNARLVGAAVLALGLALAAGCDSGSPTGGTTDPGACVHISSAAGVQLVSHGQQLFY